MVKRKGPVTQMREDLEMKKREVAELSDNRLRALAELDNFRKLMLRKMDDYKETCKFEFFLKVIPILDGLDRAMNNTLVDNNPESFYKGIEMIYREFRNALESLGLVEFSALGETFDPSRHEAVATMVVEDKPENIVVEEIHKGYMVGDRVIKPAQVIVTTQKKGGQDNVENNRH